MFGAYWDCAVCALTHVGWFGAPEDKVCIKIWHSS